MIIVVGMLAEPKIIVLGYQIPLDTKYHWIPNIICRVPTTGFLWYSVKQYSDSMGTTAVGVFVVLFVT